ncbi:helix-turn-helix transcriptional regulator [Nocardia sp. CNY236]|uniref:ArsR/SmtB family transcription factor n=1 Tax=Nocardia sp. CNY236 TaxID=1169152 RepID=UPI000567FFA1|nr:metalloregulator ArsR/SmtB family transcription factor [Nocardia sp. CNY236]
MQGARAIADPVRREILDLLHTAPLTAGAIAEYFAISRPAVSKHLRILTECGVVEVTAAGRQRIYALRTEPLTEVAAYLDRLLRPAMAGRLDALATEVARTRRERRTTRAESTSDIKEKPA